MIRTILKTLLIGVAFLIFSCTVKESILLKKDIDYYVHLKPEHKEVLRDWLKSKTHLRPATEEKDSVFFVGEGKSKGDLKLLRDAVGENGHQFYSTGDMNGDGKEDFVVLLVDTDEENQKGSPESFALAIFNAPFKVGQNPAYYDENLWDISMCYVVYDKISKNHLFLGRFKSDIYCETYYPKEETYYPKGCFNK